jgi:hypothetical protein
MDIDVRMLAVLLIIVGMILGGFLSVFWLGLVTTFIAGGATVFLTIENRRATCGTSGALGMTLLILGGIATLLIPAWIICLLK